MDWNCDMYDLFNYVQNTDDLNKITLINSPFTEPL